MRASRITYACLALAWVAPSALPLLNEDYSAAFAAETPQVWDNSLADLSGVWASERGHQIKMLFSKDVSALSDPLLQELIIPVSVDGGDVTYKSIIPNVNVLEDLRRTSKALRERGAVIPEDLKTIRRNWNLLHTSFNITMIGSTGDSTVYGFVRKLSPEEARQLSDVKAKSEAALRQQAAGIAKEQQSNATSANRQADVLSSPDVKAAAARLGMGEPFFRSSLEAQEAALRDANDGVNKRIEAANRELTQLNNTKAVSDYDEEKRQKRIKELEARLSPLNQQREDLATVSAALSNTSSEADLPGANAKADSYYEDEDENKKPPK